MSGQAALPPEANPATYHVCLRHAHLDELNYAKLDHPPPFVKYGKRIIAQWQRSTSKSCFWADSRQVPLSIPRRLARLPKGSPPGLSHPVPVP